MSALDGNKRGIGIYDIDEDLSDALFDLRGIGGTRTDGCDCG